jgi:hypothetical protein
MPSPFPPQGLCICCSFYQTHHILVCKVNGHLRIQTSKSGSKVSASHCRAPTQCQVWRESRIPGPALTGQNKNSISKQNEQDGDPYVFGTDRKAKCSESWQQ